MLPFFRKIRWRLAQDNQFFKYSRYAIGEIVLVVVGILIALQINNWNTLKQQSKESDQFSKRLLNEVISNINLVDGRILRTEQMITSYWDILNLIDENEHILISNELDSLIYNCIGMQTLKLNLGTLEEGLNTGKIALIKSDSLRTFLYSFPASIAFVRDLERQINTDYDMNFAPFLYKNFNWRKMDGTYSRYKEKIGTTRFPEYDNLKVLKSMEFENLIDNRVFMTLENKANYEFVKRDLIRLKTLIENSIDPLNK